MNPRDFRFAAGVLIAATAATLAGFAGAADPARKNTPIRAESRVPAEAPLLGRIVITADPKQLAAAREERRLAEMQAGAMAAQRAHSEYGRRAL